MDANGGRQLPEDVREAHTEAHCTVGYLWQQDVEIPYCLTKKQESELNRLHRVIVEAQGQSRELRSDWRICSHRLNQETSRASSRNFCARELWCCGSSASTERKGSSWLNSRHRKADDKDPGVAGGQPLASPTSLPPVRIWVSGPVAWVSGWPSLTPRFESASTWGRARATRASASGCMLT